MYFNPSPIPLNIYVLYNTTFQPALALSCVSLISCYTNSITVENVVLCKMSPLQSMLYKHLLGSHLVKSCLRRSTTFSPHLVCIGALKKLCNSPCFIYQAAAVAGACEEQSAREDSPDGVGFVNKCDVA